MRILLLAHSFNSLTQRLFVALRGCGHQVSVEFDIADSVTSEAVDLFKPELIIAPFLKRAIPASVWQQYVCLIVHPGIAGDRGPSSLDWAILNGESEWGVTVLQANAEMDAGDIWAQATFAMRLGRKGSLYRNEVTVAAVSAVLEAIDKFNRGVQPVALADVVQARGILRPPLQQTQRGIDWQNDSSAVILSKIHSADSFPGVLDALFGLPCYVYDAHIATPSTLNLVSGMAGDIVARREHAVLRLTSDGAVWIGHARMLRAADELEKPFKLPVADCFPEQVALLPELQTELAHAVDEWSELRYYEQGDVGFLSFDFYNGAMSTGQCQRLRAAVQYAKRQPTRVLVLSGGEDFFSNGIHLNRIEASAHRPFESAADESWHNINAMNDLALEILTASNHLTVSALRGNAGAGGVFLALASDKVWAHEHVLLNPHYKNMGNLYGSEYWTYLLPQRVGTQAAHSLMQNRHPLAAPDAVSMGVIDAVFGSDVRTFSEELASRAAALARAPDFNEQLAAKRARRERDEAIKPLQQYREEELAKMRRNFYGFDPSYHVSRYHFVHKMLYSWTPRHLAIHRNNLLKATVPSP